MGQKIKTNHHKTMHPKLWIVFKWLATTHPWQKLSLSPQYIVAFVAFFSLIPFVFFFFVLAIYFLTCALFFLFFFLPPSFLFPSLFIFLLHTTFNLPLLAQIVYVSSQCCLSIYLRCILNSCCYLSIFIVAFLCLSLSFVITVYFYHAFHYCLIIFTTSLLLLYLLPFKYLLFVYFHHCVFVFCMF